MGWRIPIVAVLTLSLQWGFIPGLLPLLAQSPVNTQDQGQEPEQDLDRLYQLGREQANRGQRREAIATYTQMLNLARQGDHREGEGLALLALGFQQESLGDRSLALDSYQQALAITRELQDRRGELLLLTNIAEIYRVTGQVDRALLLHQQVLAGRQELGDRAGVARTLNFIPRNDFHLRQDATLDTFKANASNFSILPIATHGCFVRGGCPDLGMAENTILFADRNLNIADAARLGLGNVNLVTLSACQTAVEANTNGEEFAGIAYLFERTGAKSVVASLWSVDDSATKLLMVNFYQNLQRGMTKGESLRQAKLTLINRHPYYWSAFILIGDAR